MKINLYKRNFLSLNDFTKDEILYLINLSIKLKKEKKQGIFKQRLKNKSIAMLFEKASTRTRCAASVACFDEGAHAEFLGKDEIQMGKKESLPDTARVLGRMFDAILFRGYKQETVEKLAEYSRIPVINGLTDEFHPTQILADFMVIKEHFNKLENIKIAFIGDGQNNMAKSLLVGAYKMDMNISIASPKALWPDDSLIKNLKEFNQEKFKNIFFTEDPYQAVKNADVVYTDVWISMGEENKLESKKKINLLKKYTVDNKLMKATNKDSTVFLHCLPASHKNEKHFMEVTEDVFESKQSCVFEQAENRLHTIKAILVSILRGL